jgi:outer membrane protein assembly factor BamB
VSGDATSPESGHAARPASTVRPPLRWWPAAWIVGIVTAVIVVMRLRDSVPFQQRNLQTLGAVLIGFGLLLLWWILLSRAPWKLRVGAVLLVLGLGGACAGLFRIAGVDGDLVPILEPRWARRTPPESPAAPLVKDATRNVATNAGTALPPEPPGRDFPQFLGPDRTAVVSGVTLNPDWAGHSPKLLWRQPVGAAWSGFAVVGNRALTQEQRGGDECVTCYDLATGRLLWTHSDPARYETTIAGEGPRCTPTVVGGRVYALGATGILNCLDLETGRQIWQREITNDAKSRMPEWGFSGSPLVLEGRVYVSAGGKPDKSLLAYDAATGEIAWAAGGASVSHSSPFAATLAGVPQILMFNSRRITAHEQQGGRVVWEYPWGVGQPHVAVPIVVASNRVVFTSGYGVGCELLEIGPGPASADNGGTNRLAATRIWKSIRMKAKFSNPVVREGYLYGLDDGVMACVDLRDGSQRWKEGRHGHGQGLLLGEHYLLMAEDGELVLLRPTPEGPNELGRHRVFAVKTWNPIAVAGPYLLVRSDREAAALRLSLAPSTKPAPSRP